MRGRPIKRTLRGDVELLPAPGERRVIGRRQVEFHQPEQRR